MIFALSINVSLGHVEFEMHMDLSGYVQHATIYQCLQFRRTPRTGVVDLGVISMYSLKSERIVSGIIEH